MISQRQCISPRPSVDPMYTPGRLRTASRPSSTDRWRAVYPSAGIVPARGRAAAGSAVTDSPRMAAGATGPPHGRLARRTDKRRQPRRRTHWVTPDKPGDTVGSETAEAQRRRSLLAYQGHSREGHGSTTCWAGRRERVDARKPPEGTTRGRRHDRRYGPYEAVECTGPVRSLRRPGIRARRAPWWRRASVLRASRAAARRGAGARRHRDPGRDRPPGTRQGRVPQPLKVPTASGAIARSLIQWPARAVECFEGSRRRDQAGDWRPLI